MKLLQKLLTLEKHGWKLKIKTVCAGRSEES